MRLLVPSLLLVLAGCSDTQSAGGDPWPQQSIGVAAREDRLSPAEAAIRRDDVRIPPFEGAHIDDEMDVLP